MSYAVLFFLFGIFGLLTTQVTIGRAYDDLTSSIRYLEGQLTIIYIVSALGFALWMCAGSLFMFLPARAENVELCAT